MPKRYASMWFRHLQTDWLTIRQPDLRELPFVVAAPDRGRMIITAASPRAEAEGLQPGMVVADARALIPELPVFDEKPGRAGRLLQKIGEWAIRYTPLVSVDGEDGLLLDTSGCTHLWGGEVPYLKEIARRLRSLGYDVRMAMADSPLAAWAVCRWGKGYPIIPPGATMEALAGLPPAALRLDPETVDRLQRLGLSRIDSFATLPRPALRRRFGPALLQRLDQALGLTEEFFLPVCPVEAFAERLPCLEPIATRTGIEIALQRLLNTLCERLRREGKGLRTAVFKGFRLDGKQVQVEISTTRGTNKADDLFALFGIRLGTMEPDTGIELFVLEAPKVEEVNSLQETIWAGAAGLEDIGLAALLDRVIGKLGAAVMHRYLPEESYWPERSIREAGDLREQPTTLWRTDVQRPEHLLPRPEAVEVTAPIPDYPPMLFRWKGVLHKIAKADGPERIEREWWIEEGLHRDYYTVEDDEGRRYWLFRSGPYTEEQRPQWFVHGFFA